MDLVWITFEICINALEAALDVYLYTCLFIPKPGARRPLIPALITLSLYFCWLEITMTWDVPYILESAVIIAICYGFLLLFRSGHWAKKLLWVALANAVNLSIIYAVSWLQSIMTHTDISIQYVQGIERFVNVSLIHVVYMLFVWLVTHLRSLNDETTTPQMLAMTMLSLSNICILLLVEYATQFVHTETWAKISTATSIGVLAASLITLWLFNRLSAQARAMAHLHAQAYHAELQKQFFGEIKLLYGEIRTWRHDYQHHMQALEGALANGKVTQAQAYIADYLSNFSIPKHYYTTQNVMLDALLSTKLMRAENAGIEVLTQIVLPKQLPISDTNLCALLGNLLDNSITACEQVEPGRRFIELTILSMRENLCIKIRNATADKERHLGSKITSTKKGPGLHGIGLSSIDAIIQSAEGFCERHQENYEFMTTILLPMQF